MGKKLNKSSNSTTCNTCGFGFIGNMGLFFLCILVFGFLVHVDIWQTTYLPDVDNRGHFTLHLPTSSYPRSFWMTPNSRKICNNNWISQYHIPYAHHYNPRLVYFLPHFWSPFLWFHGFAISNKIFFSVNQQYSILWKISNEYSFENQNTPPKKLNVTSLHENPIWNFWK